MKSNSPRIRIAAATLIATGLTIGALAINLVFHPAKSTAADAATPLVKGYGALPLSFEANRTHPKIDFIAQGHGYELFLGANEATLVVQARKSAAAKPSEAFALRMKLRGANEDGHGQGLDQLAGHKNFLVGNDPAKWQRNIPLFGKIRYAEVYRGVDVVYYGNQRQLEYDFVIAPSADPAQIGLEFEGAQDLRINEQGDLVVTIGSGEMRFRRPDAYQSEANEKARVEVGYTLASNGSVGFAVGAYDSNRELVIDPVLRYSTFVGGEGFDEGNGIAVDASGNAYIVGTSLSSQYPVTPGAISSSSPGVVVTKLNAAGSALVYSTFLGGTAIGFTNEGFGIAVNAAGEAAAVGGTASPDFPTTSNAFDTTCGTDGLCNSNRRDAFLSKLSADGTSLLYSTFFGGNETDQAFGVAVDARGMFYVVGSVQSLNMPVVSAFQPTCGGGFSGCSDAFVAKFDTTRSGLASLIYSTYLGGTGDEGAQGVAIDRKGSAYVVGSTISPNFPTTAGAFDRTCGADGQCDDINSVSPGSDAFVTKLHPHGTSLIYSTFLGGNGTDLGAAIAVDRAGQVYVTGAVQSTDFVTTPPAFRRTINGIQDAFVTVLNTGGSAVTASTYLGGFAEEGGAGIALDRNNNVHIIGTTDSSDFPTTPNRLFGFGGGEEPFVTKLPPALDILIYSTFFGSSDDDFGSAIAVAGRDTYITGSTHGPGFPTTPGAFDRECGTDGICNDDIEDAYIAKLTLPSEAVLFPAAELSETFFDFGAVNVGMTSPPKVSVLTSTGTAPLLITSIVATGDFAQTNDCPASLPPGQECSISITFTPTQKGGRVGQVQVTHNAQNSPQIITLTGTGISNAKASLSPGDINFGNVKVGTTSPPRTETITSIGTSDLVITDVFVGAPFAQTNNCIGHPIPPGGQCTVNITYSPTRTGGDFTIFQLTDNTSQFNAASITGNGIP